VTELSKGSVLAFIKAETVRGGLVIVMRQPQKK
jgi:hypothetical protein